MHISRILVYPIKSLRPYEPSSAEVTRHGFAYDRRFMLLKVKSDGSLENMHVAHFPELVLFFADIEFPKHDQDAADQAVINLTWRPPQGESKSTSIPLTPDTTSLEVIHVNMHSSPTRAYKMHDQYNSWISSCLGYDAILAYLGDNSRAVLMTTHQTQPQQDQRGWLSSITNKLPTSLNTLISGDNKDKITFADCAPFLIVNEASIHDISRRLPEGQNADISKFRPNIVISDKNTTAWEEDYWAELSASSSNNNKTPIKLHLVQNCVRCISINIDYATGKPGLDETGKILKKLQSDRRVDKGHKYSPVFGRYAFLGQGDEGKRLSVGDEIEVSGRNEERTVFDWPGISSPSAPAAIA